VWRCAAHQQTRALRDLRRPHVALVYRHGEDDDADQEALRDAAPRMRQDWQLPAAVQRAQGAPLTATAFWRSTMVNVYG
jgi:hypothetical protein